MCVFRIFCAGQKEHFSHVFKYLKYHARHRTTKKGEKRRYGNHFGLKKTDYTFSKTYFTILTAKRALRRSVLSE